MDAGTAMLAMSADLREDELTISVRAFELGYFMALNKGYTVKQAAQEFALSPSGAYRLLERICASRRVPVVPIEGEYRVMDDKEFLG